MQNSDVPLSVAALLTRLSPDRIRRRIISGEVEGGLVDGRWRISARGLEQLKAIAQGDRTSLPPAAA